MGRKVKVGKSRKDKFYNLAKQQGLRARSSFKLSQLAQKFNLFDSCLYVIDLCAAPGGWMQIASQSLPVSGHVFGVDLVPIAPIPKCTSIQADITTERCEKLLRREMNAVGVPNLEVDLVLHDGAPNVGADWNKDAYVQNELVLRSLQLAIKFLKPRGHFVTKVFRSQDYTKLLYVFQQLFKHVQATKPQASRNVSAEIFVVCSGYLAPKKIAPQLFDLNTVFEHVEEGPTLGSIAREGLTAAGSKKAQLQQGGLTKAYNLMMKKRRGGYEEGDDYRVVSLRQFFESANASGLLVTSSKIEIKKDDPFDAEILGHSSTTAAMLERCEDIKLLGKSDLEALLRWRYRILLEKQKAEEAALKAAAVKQEVEKEEKSVDEIQKEMDAELDALLQKEAKAELKKLRKDRARRRKQEMKRKIAEAVFEPQSHDPMLFSAADSALLEEAPLVEHAEGGADGLDVYVSDDEVEEAVSDFDDEIDYIDLLAKEMEHIHQEQKKEEIMRKLGQQRKKRETKKEQKRKEWAQEVEGLLGTIDAKNMDRVAAQSDSDEEEEETRTDDEATDADTEESDDEGVETNADSDMDEETRLVKSLDKEIDEEEEIQRKVPKAKSKLTDLQDKSLQIKSKLFFNDELFEGVRDLDEGKVLKRKAKIDPIDLSAFSDSDTEGVGNKKRARNGSDTEDTDIEELSESELPKIPLSEHKQRKLKRKAEQERRDMRDAKKARKEAKLLQGLGASVEEIEAVLAKSIKKNTIEEVPVEEPKIKVQAPKHKEDLAEIQALGSLMIKRKSRMDLMDGMYNRWAFEDDENLPEWFKEDDEQARIPELPITKELMDQYRARLREIAERPAKKVAEARARKKAQAERRMAALKKQAMQIAENEDLTEAAKSQSINKLMRKANRKEKKDKTYVATRKSGATVAVGKGGSGPRVLVDRRMKADKRAKRAANKRRK
eukprot:Blabericola_migrator_1__6302@NODE_317_length_9889_cov_67_793016_g258_i0_p1_GENE_NODE_317_length_9889_cov_67_793016_g258_i0NODE_317_length_9889_cov_67_793016_g258_i0_p1_ORF_typecomplete_len946_score282_17Spb1_C/PF07780_12/1_4e04Spb1_C/PF07780_12/1_8e04Spb1_C/PF07780_12/1_7e57FtsJ/PF01728_19/2_7e53DUF3381/PF11861_8/5_9e03DUF3381/PF11861_8/9_9e25DUF3381/PF11861_8/33DUF3381/PF11861_8/3_6e02DUF3381/PF11861_8/6_8e02DUF3381/PF11861_8/3_9e03DUF3381/PF11861_8/1_8e04Methyltrans_Mon/PF14314_6/3_6e05Methylt